MVNVDRSLAPHGAHSAIDGRAARPAAGARRRVALASARAVLASVASLLWSCGGGGGGTTPAVTTGTVAEPAVVSTSGPAARAEPSALIPAVAGLPLAIAPAPGSADFVVDPVNGDDRNDGRSTATAFRTLPHARDVLRAWLASHTMSGDVRVYLRAGDYDLTTPDCSHNGLAIPAGLCLLPADSANGSGNTIRYVAYDGVGTARLLGATRLSSAAWTPVVVNGVTLYRYPWTGGEFHDLYENGVRANKARSPDVNGNYGSSTTSQGPYLLTAGPVCPDGSFGNGRSCCRSASEDCASHSMLQYSPADRVTAGWKPAADGHLQVHLFAGGNQNAVEPPTAAWARWNWASFLLPVTAFDQPAGIIRTALANGSPISRFHIASGNRFFVQGDLSMLNAPGEYHVDAAGQWLYYYPRNGDPQASNAEILAPRVAAIVQLCFDAACTDQASFGGPHDISFEGLTFQGSDFTSEWPDYRFLQNPPGRKVPQPVAMLHLNSTQRIRIVANRFLDAGQSAIAMLRHNRGNIVYGNWIENVGNAGVLIRAWNASGTCTTRDGSPPADGYPDLSVAGQNQGHVVVNNVIRFVGMHQSPDGWGIFEQCSGNDTFAHNLIEYGPRGLLGGGPDDASGGNYWGYNILRHGSQDSADIAPFYVTGTGLPNETGAAGAPRWPLKIAEQMLITFSEPTVWDASSMLAGYPLSVMPFGFYLDNASSNWSIRNVQVTNPSSATDVGDPDFRVHYYLYNRGNDITSNAEANVSWAAHPNYVPAPRQAQGAFDATKMDLPNIGPLPDFPFTVDGVRWTWRNDDHGDCRFEGSWSVRRDASVAGDYAGDEHWSNTPGDSFTCTFSGVAVRWAASTSANRGTVDVYLDGRLDATRLPVATAIPRRQRIVYERTGLAPGAHSLKVVIRDDLARAANYVVLDALGSHP